MHWLQAIPWDRRSACKPSKGVELASLLLLEFQLFSIISTLTNYIREKMREIRRPQCHLAYKCHSPCFSYISQAFVSFICGTSESQAQEQCLFIVLSSSLVTSEQPWVCSSLLFFPLLPSLLVILLRSGNFSAFQVFFSPSF